MLATIDDLATRLEAGGGEIPGALRERIAQFARLKLVEVLEVDFQDRGPSGETRFDDENGLRDFSAGTVEQRRAYGYELATARLARASRRLGRPRAVRPSAHAS